MDKYNHKELESKIYKYWMDKDCFRADSASGKWPFTISMPPPNITGQLHMGHALDLTMQDILVRFKRMQGFEALWLPGCDHAGIATQIKVEEVLREAEGKTRYDLGREGFLARVWEWKEQYGSRINEQIEKLGASCDWSRARFTMDDDYAEAVREVFVKLYDEGLIYQGSRIINWCPECTTALSDAEVEYEDKDGHFWHIRYPVVSSQLTVDSGIDGIVIATTRPETMLGDVAIAVNPNDERYKKLIGQKLILPLVGREISIIADEMAELGKGTGAVKITPAHDPNDFECGLRHGLESIRVMDDNAVINELGGKYAGMERYAARRAILADLEAGGYLVEIKPHVHSVGECYRCSTVVEPIISKQWFVKMAPLATEALEVVKSGEVEFVPERFSKTYLNWMENVHDWCISRQLWWGHRIPAFTCEACGEMAVSSADVKICAKCGSGKIMQDEDVLDTWFSSALWPFATLGYPKKTEDLEFFYPNDVLVTGYDIIFFWVARMIFSGLHHTGKKPFDKVLIHGIIRDEQGRKMSKSLGNGIDPLEIIEEYGADALRAGLISGVATGNDMRFSSEKVESFSRFANKLWNAARFVHMNVNEQDLGFRIQEAVGAAIGRPEAATNQNSADAQWAPLQLEDKWILHKLNELVKETTENLENYELGIAFDKIYAFVWDEFCDWYIEMVKPGIQDSGFRIQDTIEVVLINMLKLLHMFMPFITEEIYQAVGGAVPGAPLMLAEFPKHKEEWNFEKEHAEVEILKEIITQIRNKRAEINAHPARLARIYIEAADENAFSCEFFKALAKAEEIVFAKKSEHPSENAFSFVAAGNAVITMETGNLVDVDKKRAMLEEEIAKFRKELEFNQKMLNNADFMDKAPAHLIEEKQEKCKNYEAGLADLERQLAELQSSRLN